MTGATLRDEAGSSGGRRRVGARGVLVASLVGLGAAVGIAASIGLGRVVERFLLGVGGFDLTTLLAAPLVLGLVASLAAYLPARRASRVDPVQALRTD